MAILTGGSSSGSTGTKKTQRKLQEKTVDVPELGGATSIRKFAQEIARLKVAGGDGEKIAKDLMKRYGSDLPDATLAQYGLERPKGGKSVFDKVKGAAGGTLMGALDLISRPGQMSLETIQAVRGTLGLGVEGSADDENSYGDIWKAATGNQTHHLNLRESVGRDPHAGGRLAGFFDIGGTIALDPITWVTAGVSAPARVGLKIAGEETAARIAARGGLKNLSEREVGELTAKVAASEQAANASKSITGSLLHPQLTAQEAFTQRTMQALRRGGQGGVKYMGRTIPGLGGANLKATRAAFGVSDAAAVGIRKALKAPGKLIGKVTGPLTSRIGEAVIPRYRIIKEKGAEYASRIADASSSSHAGFQRAINDVTSEVYKAAREAGITGEHLVTIRHALEGNNVDEAVTMLRGAGHDGIADTLETLDKIRQTKDIALIEQAGAKSEADLAVVRAEAREKILKKYQDAALKPVNKLERASHSAAREAERRQARLLELKSDLADLEGTGRSWTPAEHERIGAEWARATDSERRAIHLENRVADAEALAPGIREHAFADAVDEAMADLPAVRKTSAQLQVEADKAVEDLRQFQEELTNAEIDGLEVTEKDIQKLGRLEGKVSVAEKHAGRASTLARRAEGKAHTAMNKAGEVADKAVGRVPHKVTPGMPGELHVGEEGLVARPLTAAEHAVPYADIADDELRLFRGERPGEARHGDRLKDPTASIEETSSRYFTPNYMHAKGFGGGGKLPGEVYHLDVTKAEYDALFAHRTGKTFDELLAQQKANEGKVMGWWKEDVKALSAPTRVEAADKFVTPLTRAAEKARTVADRAAEKLERVADEITAKAATGTPEAATGFIRRLGAAEEAAKGAERVALGAEQRLAAARERFRTVATTKAKSIDKAVERAVRKYTQKNFVLMNTDWRVLHNVTKEGREGLEKAGFIVPGADLGQSELKSILAKGGSTKSRVLEGTLDEINEAYAELLNIPGLKFMEDNPITLTLQDAMHSYRMIGEVKYLHDVAKIGEDLEGQAGILFGAEEGAKKKAKELGFLEMDTKGYGKIYVDPVLKPEVERLSAVMYNDKAMEGWSKFIDKWGSLWAGYATTPLLFGTGFFARNSMGNMFNNFLAGVVDPLLYIRAYHTERAYNAAIKETGRELGPEFEAAFVKQLEKRYSKSAALKVSPRKADAIRDAKLFQDALDTGAHETGYFTSDTSFAKPSSKFRKATKLGEEEGGVRWGLANPLDKNSIWLEPGAKFNRRIENNARVAHFFHVMDTTGDKVMASRSVKKYLFDYSDLTAFEKKNIRSVVRFYTYMRKNTPLQFAEIIHHPGKFAGMAHVRQGIADTFGDEEGGAFPGYATDAGDLPIGGTMFGLDTPLSAATDAVEPAVQLLANVLPDKVLKSVGLGNLRPQGGFGEVARNLVNVPQGGPVELGKALVEQATGKSLFTGGDIKKGGMETVKRLLGAVAPPFSKANKTATVLKNSDQRDVGRIRLLNTLLGFHVTPLDEQSQATEYAHRASLTGEAIDRLKDEGVDVPTLSQLRAAGIIPPAPKDGPRAKSLTAAQKETQALTELEAGGSDTSGAGTYHVERTARAKLKSPTKKKTKRSLARASG